MQGQLAGFLQQAAGLPAPWLYAILAFAAALENIVPPVPADVVVLFGGFLAGRGAASPAAAFVSVWLGNVAGALLVFGAGRRYGQSFFAGRWGRLLLRPGQLDRLSAFYQRFGIAVIFVSRFLPMFRAVVPVFAGVAGLSLRKAVPPIAVASALWYGALVYLGAFAGENWREVLRVLHTSGRWLAVVALVAALALARWWWRTRREEQSA